MSLLHYFLTEPSLTRENLKRVLENLSDDLWEEFGGSVNTPEPEREKIKQICSSDRERKLALIDSFMAYHPAPSWILVAKAVFLTGWGFGNDQSCQWTLDLLQQLFPTGMLIKLLWSMIELVSLARHTWVSEVWLSAYSIILSPPTPPPPHPPPPPPPPRNRV